MSGCESELFSSSGLQKNSPGVVSVIRPADKPDLGIEIGLHLVILRGDRQFIVDPAGLKSSGQVLT